MIFSLLPLAAFLVLVAILVTPWVVNRDNTAVSPLPRRKPRSDETAAVNTPEGKAEMMRQQIIAKIHWGARDREVYDWLQERHGITGDKADELLAMAHRAKRKAVRIKALVIIVCSGCGVLVTGGLMCLQLWSHLVIVGWAPVMVYVIGFTSLAVFLRSLWQLLTGKMEGSVD